jgi:hypothetical protein
VCLPAHPHSRPVMLFGQLLCVQAEAAYPTDMMIAFDGPWLCAACCAFVVYC